jgi:hypothetical protein
MVEYLSNLPLLLRKNNDFCHDFKVNELKRIKNYKKVFVSLFIRDPKI